MRDQRFMKFLKFWFPAILYSGIIFCVSSIANVTTPLPEVQFDKILHILVYSPFGFLVARGINGSWPDISPKSLWILVVLAAFLYGLSDEYHQTFVPGRNFGTYDLLADTIGGTIGGYIFLLYRKNNDHK